MAVIVMISNYFTTISLLDGYQMADFKTNTEKYLHSRAHFRKVAQNDFLNFNPNANDLAAISGEIVASITLFLSGKRLLDIRNGLYIGDLIVSFCRSHFISSDLILGGELVEAAVILRKQMELIARLNECMEDVDIESLIKRNPNVKHLKTKIKRMYSEYSEIAHSASPNTISILGRSENEGGAFTPVYPIFDENSYVALQHMTVLVFEFYLSVSVFSKNNFVEYDGTRDTILFEELIEKHQAMFGDGEFRKSK
jgi:hypothetical protein